MTKTTEDDAFSDFWDQFDLKPSPLMITPLKWSLSEEETKDLMNEEQRKVYFPDTEELKNALDGETKDKFPDEPVWYPGRGQ